MGKKKLLFIINGPGGVGKDTFIEFSETVFEKRGLKVFNISSIDKIREAAKLLGLTEKDEKGRQFLIDIKDASIRYNDGPIKYVSSRIEEAEEGVFFLHIREPVEITKIKKIYPEIITIHLDRDDAIKFNTSADTNTLNIDYDYYLKNNGSLKEFRKQVEEFLEANLNNFIK